MSAEADSMRLTADDLATAWRVLFHAPPPPPPTWIMGDRARLALEARYGNGQPIEHVLWGYPVLRDAVHPWRLELVQ